MRLLFVDQFSDFGGAQLVLRDIMDEARKRGWELWFTAPGNGGLFEYCREVGIPALSLPVSTYRNGSKTLRDVVRYAFDMSRRAADGGDREAKSNRRRLCERSADSACGGRSDDRRPLTFHLHSALDKTVFAGDCAPGTAARAAARLSPHRNSSPARCLPTRRTIRFGLSITASAISVSCPGRARDAALKVGDHRPHFAGKRAPRLCAGGAVARRTRLTPVQFIVVGAALFSDPCV